MFRTFHVLNRLKSIIKNIALFGVDANEEETGRSDSLMIATIDPVHKKIKITSIMRDLYVNVPDYGMDKIKHTYALGVLSFQLEL